MTTTAALILDTAEIIDAAASVADARADFRRSNATYEAAFAARTPGRARLLAAADSREEALEDAKRDLEMAVRHANPDAVESEIMTATHSF